LFYAFVALVFSLTFALGGRTPQSSIIGLSSIVLLMILVRIIQSLMKLREYKNLKGMLDYPNAFMTDLMRVSRALNMTGGLNELALYDEARLSAIGLERLQLMGKALLEAEAASKRASGTGLGWTKMIRAETEARNAHREAYELFRLFGITKVQYGQCFPAKEQATAEA
jgi:hypothetical protein